MNPGIVRCACASLATLTLTAGVAATVVLVVDVNAANASPAAPVAEASSKPVPKVTGKPRHWGSTVEASTTQRGRQERKGSQSTRTQPPTSKVTTKPAKPRRFREPQSVDARRDIRMNIGICGRVQTDGTVPGPNRCQPGGVERKRTTPPEVVRPRPENVTWEQVRSETKNVMFPGLSVKVQPNGRTLVNLDTIVYTADSKVSTTIVTLLGFPVVVEATPISYTWRFGDGSPALTTSTPGKPYPSKEITHKYMKRGAVSLTLTTNYAARFNVADTGWQYIDGTVPITGPATALQVREAVPVLVDPGR
jgi:hypothetical protein